MTTNLTYSPRMWNEVADALETAGAETHVVRFCRRWGGCRQAAVTALATEEQARAINAVDLPLRYGDLDLVDLDGIYGHIA